VGQIAKNTVWRVRFC